MLASAYTAPSRRPGQRLAQRLLGFAARGQAEHQIRAAAGVRVIRLLASTPAGGQRRVEAAHPRARGGEVGASRPPASPRPSTATPASRSPGVRLHAPVPTSGGVPWVWKVSMVSAPRPVPSPARPATRRWAASRGEHQPGAGVAQLDPVTARLPHVEEEGLLDGVLVRAGLDVGPGFSITSAARRMSSRWSVANAT